MIKKLLALSPIGFLCATFLVNWLGNWTTVQALPPKALSSKSVQPLSQKIDLPFNKVTDGKTLLPNRPVSNQPYDDGRVIIGSDDRKPVLSRAYPWSAIGRLEWQTASGEVISWCTATLIGEDLLLTNSHCLDRPVVDPRTGQVAVDPNGKYVTQFTDSQTYQTISDRLIFKPSLINGRSIDKARVVSYRSGWTKNSQNLADDWALLKIDQRLGAANRYGYMGWRTLDFSNFNVQKASADFVRLAGYSGDFPTDKLREFGQAGDTAGVDAKCSILNADQGLLSHDCDTNPGASGGAIFGYFTDGNYYILGLHAGSNSLQGSVRLPDGVITQAINRGVQVSQWSTQALSMRQ